MAQANIFYKGEEKKFAVKIEAAGFSMDDDDFEIEVTNGKESFSVLKAGEPTGTHEDPNQPVWSNEDGSLVVFYEEETVEVPAEEPGGEATPNTVKHWFCILDTQYFNYTGQLNVIGTAYVTDQKAYDGVRKSIDTAILGTLKNK